jgi:hypothetical protein
MPSFSEWIQQMKQPGADKLSVDEFYDLNRDAFQAKVFVNSDGELIFKDVRLSRKIACVILLPKEFNIAYNVRYNDDILAFGTNEA